MKYIVFVIISFFFAGCNYTTQKNLSSLSGGQGQLASSTIIDFQLIKNYSLSSCMNCHSGSQTPDISSSAGARASIVRILTRVDQNTMPPANAGYQALNACQKALLHKWSDLGAPDTSTTTVASVPECANVGSGVTVPAPPVVPISQMPLNYNTLLTKILQPKCTMCHSATGSMPDLQFFPYSTLMLKASKWMAPGKNSTVYQEVIQKTMPPKSSGISFLTTEESDFLAKWIDAGKPEY